MNSDGQVQGVVLGHGSMAAGLVDAVRTERVIPYFLFASNKHSAIVEV